jgi:hypothetical protein
MTTRSAVRPLATTCSKIASSIPAHGGRESRNNPHFHPDDFLLSLAGLLLDVDFVVAIAE